MHFQLLSVVAIDLYFQFDDLWPEFHELLAIKLILDEVGVTKVKHPNKGHTPNKGQKPMYQLQGIRYSKSPLYCILAKNLISINLEKVYMGTKQ